MPTTSVASEGMSRRSWPRRAARLTGMAAACYGGVLVVLLLLENSMLFHPITATQDWEAPPNARVRDVVLHTADGVRCHAWWCPTPQWQPGQAAILYCHGNAGNLSHRASSVARLQQHLNLAVLIFDYPGYGRSEGTPSEAACYAAANAAYDWLGQTQQVPPERLVLYGGSLGGGVAVDLARRRPHGALVLVSTFTSVPDLAQKLFPWLPARWLVRNRFDNLAKIDQCTQPVFIAHGTTDGLVPYTQGQRLFAAAHEPKQFLRMEGFGHNEVLGPAFYAACQAFLANTTVLAGPTGVVQN